MKPRMKKNIVFRLFLIFCAVISFSFCVNSCYAESAQVDISEKLDNKYTVNIKNGKGFVARIEYSVPGIGSRQTILFTLLFYNERFCPNYS